MLFDIIHFFIEKLIALVGYSGYLGIVLLMTIESSFIPLPAELILIPAGALVARGELSFTLVLIAGTVGSVLGALVNYILAYHLGRRAVNRLIHKYGKLFFVNEATVLKSERYFDSHGEITTFIGRLIPGVRSFVSLPAGFVKMGMIRFCVFTAIGAGIWNLLLIYVGYLFGDNLDLIQANLKEITLVVIAAAAIITISYIIWHKSRKRSKARYQMTHHHAHPKQIAV